MSLDSLHVSLQVSEVTLLVKVGLLKVGRIDNVNDLLCAILECLGCLFGRGVASNVDVAFLDNDRLAIDLVDNVVDLLPKRGEDKWVSALANQVAPSRDTACTHMS